MILRICFKINLLFNAYFRFLMCIIYYFTSHKLVSTSFFISGKNSKWISCKFSGYSTSTSRKQPSLLFPLKRYIKPLNSKRSSTLKFVLTQSKIKSLPLNWLSKRIWYLQRSQSKKSSIISSGLSLAITSVSNFCLHYSFFIGIFKRN